MLFNSFQFLLFFLIVTVLYYAVTFRWQWLFLLIASCYFYASFIPAYLLVLFAIIIIDFIAGISIEKSTGIQRKFFLVLSITANLAVLVVFKYYNFFIDNINQFLELIHITSSPFSSWHIILPIGLSFHTFQAMAYTIEIYKGKQKPEKHFGIYALYIMFYPQLVAGPIERPQQLLHQFHEPHKPDYNNIAMGLKTMLWGFFMKVVVADRLAIYVDYVYTDVGAHSRLALTTSILFYSFQIYCDFAGYSLIAIGAAKTMGFNLSTNFRQPYLALSITDFWNRWHCTLSSWFRDYLYIPLGGSRVSALRYSINILTVFFLSGLWHGTSWGFILWGLLHGVCLLIEKLFWKKDQNKTSGFFKRAFYFFYTLVLTGVLWIFFRAQTVQEAFTVIGNMFANQTPWYIPGEFKERALLIYAVMGIVCVLFADIRTEFFPKSQILFYSKNATIRIVSSVILVVAIMLFGVFDGGQFIYFQF